MSQERHMTSLWHREANRMVMRLPGRRGGERSVAPVEVARPAGPERVVERVALDVLDRLLARPGKAGGAELRGRLAVERLLDPCLLLALEERVVLEGIAAVQVRVERHCVVEPGIPGSQLQVLPDGLREGRLRGDRCVFEFGHDATVDSSARASRKPCTSRIFAPFVTFARPKIVRRWRGATP